MRRIPHRNGANPKITAKNAVILVQRRIFWVRFPWATWLENFRSDCPYVPLMCEHTLYQRKKYTILYVLYKPSAIHCNIQKSSFSWDDVQDEVFKLIRQAVIVCLWYYSMVWYGNAKGSMFQNCPTFLRSLVLMLQIEFSWTSHTPLIICLFYYLSVVGLEFLPICGTSFEYV